MNAAEWAITKKTTALVLAVFLLGGGIVAYEQLGRLEDPEFTIKDALVITHYPGATPKEVEEEVTEPIETKIQELGQVKRITSISKAGESIITVTIKDKFDKHTLPQVWDELRRKVNDAQAKLPPGVKHSVVFDDYGDVYGVMLAVTGDGFTDRELFDYADFLKRELSLVKDVAKVVTWGKQQEEIFVEISRSKMAQLGIGLEAIYRTLEKQNLVVNAGRVKVGKEYIRISPTGEIDSVDEIANLLIRGTKTKKLIYLNDIGTVSRGYVTPPTKHARYNGKKAMVVAVSTVSGGNVVTMGEAISKRLQELENQTPVGMKIHIIYYQAGIVTESINNFLVSLMQALAIVIVVLVLFMGLRSGILIGAILLITVSGTMIFMNIQGVNLERISLGALIIALGMLVDNAIVVTEGMLIRIEAGMDRLKAAKEVVIQNQWPLLGATVVAILAFAAIGLSQDSTGEYTRSLFQVIFISLLLSWFTAITLTPLFCYMFLKGKPAGDGEPADPYKGILFQMYKGILKACIRLRWITLGAVIGLLWLAIHTFGYLENSFFPDSTSPNFMIHYWLPEGTDIRKTSADIKKIEKFIMKQDGINYVSSYIGGGAPRYMLVYAPEKDYDSYGMILVTVKDFRKIPSLLAASRKYTSENFPDSNPRYERIRLGPGDGFRIEARINGPNPNILRKLGNEALAIYQKDDRSYSHRLDWRERVKVLRPQFAEAQARKAGISRDDLAQALETTFSGTKVGLYRERTELIPIISRPPKPQRIGVDNINDVQIWSHIGQTTVPIKQVITTIKTSWEDGVIHRRNKKRTLTVQTEQIKGNASAIFDKARPEIEAIKLPVGYELEWGGEYEDTADAQAGLKANLGVTVVMMVFITIILFNALRQPLIIWLTVPLAMIGVSFGLLFANESFGFMALLGFLSLTGMLIKNAVVLIDEIDTQIASGKDKFDGIIDASVSRLRPVGMAAATTILGMLPLLPDVFFRGMAVTIMSGLAFATVLTMIIVPVFYSIFFRAKYKP